MKFDLHKIMSPSILIMIAVCLVTFSVTFGTVKTNFKHRLKALKQEELLREKEYIRYIDKLHMQIAEHELTIEEIDDSISILKEINDAEIDSLLSLSLDDKLEHLSNRFGLGEQ